MEGKLNIQITNFLLPSSTLKVRIEYEIQIWGGSNIAP